MPERGRVGLLISGRGSNMVALVEAMQHRTGAPAFVKAPDAPEREVQQPVVVAFHHSVGSADSTGLELVMGDLELGKAAVVRDQAHARRRPVRTAPMGRHRTLTDEVGRREK